MVNPYLKVVGLDPSVSNFGIALTRVHLETMKVEVDNLILCETESAAKKGVIKSSDDLRRCKQVREAMMSGCYGYSIAVAEMPFMNPAGYALGNWNAAMMIGVLAGCPIPLIQVSPQEVKFAAVNHRQAAKEEMVEWGIEKHPDAPWLMRKFKGVMRPTAANEHLADALATVYAGMKTEQFAQLVAMMKSAQGSSVASV